MPLLQRAVVKLAPHHKLITSAAYVAALVWLCNFTSFDRPTEIEEHGLSPGHAFYSFTGGWEEDVREAMSSIVSAPDVVTGLDRALQNAQLISHRMNFTMFDALHGSLMYTVVPSSRGDGREALVVVLGSNWTRPVQAALSCGVGVQLARYLKTVQWLSRDVFFVFVDTELPYGAGVRAWLRAYFGGAADQRRGVLRQAVILETPSKPTSVFTDIEGINGMIPNQDIVNSYVIEAEDVGLVVHRREVWDSVYHHFRNGGVHSSHAPFLEYQLPAFTVRGRKQKRDAERGREVEPAMLGRSMEGLIRAYSNNLQQLHHSFNFYFYTSNRRHISSGIYLYPVFAMQLPLLSFLMTPKAYRDMRSFLVGVAATVLVILLAGGPVFVLATDSEAASLFRLLRPNCSRPNESEPRRCIAASWLLAGGFSSCILAGSLRHYAHRVFAVTKTHCDAGLRLPTPLWEAMRAGAGFVFLVIFASLTISSWSMAVPLTVICVPVLVLLRPLSRHWLTRSLLLVAFVSANAFFLLADSSRGSVLDVVGSFGSSVLDIYQQVALSTAREVQPYMLNPLYHWVRKGGFRAAMDGDFLTALYEAARDFNCVGGMLFPLFCFAYWPFLVVVTIICFVLPLQRVNTEGLTLREVRLGALFAVVGLVVAFLTGVYWRSMSSKGLGEFRW